MGLSTGTPHSHNIIYEVFYTIMPVQSSYNVIMIIIKKKYTHTHSSAVSGLTNRHGPSLSVLFTRWFRRKESSFFCVRFVSHSPLSRISVDRWFATTVFFVAVWTTRVKIKGNNRDLRNVSDLRPRDCSSMHTY
jgi:hypothetical protein